MKSVYCAVRTGSFKGLKYCTAVQATDGNRAHAHYMLDNQGYKHVHTYCFHAAAMVARSASVLRCYVVLVRYLVYANVT